MAHQRDKIRAVFMSRPNSWVPLPDILALGVAQYNARILELRRGGMRIENKIQEISGVRHSWFRYVTEPQRELVF